MSVVVSAISPGFTAEMYEAVTSKVMPGTSFPTIASLTSPGPSSRDGA